MKKIIIIIDNIDESTNEAIKACQSFAESLEKFHAESTTNIQLYILIPIREYININFFDIEHFAKYELPEVDYRDFVSEKFRELKTDLAKDRQKYEQIFTYSFMNKDKIVKQGRNFQFSKESTDKYISDLYAIVLDEKKNNFTKFVKDISSGNLKIFIGNLYNFFHSYKLPLDNLFLKYFAKEYNVSTDYKEHDLDEGVILENLMCIHYPFYDVANSFIVNIFNCNNSCAEDDYLNTLSIVRILLYLYNSHDANYSLVLEKFKNYTYKEEIIKAALGKCLTYGLLESSNGFHLEHFNKSTIIRYNKSTEVYLKQIINSIHYLQYVCEDVPVTESYYVPISEKYHYDENSHGSREKRELGSRKLIEFISAEEELEESALKKMRIDYEAFLYEMSFRKGDKGIKISQYMKEMQN